MNYYWLMMIDICCDGWWMRSLEHTLLSVSVITLVHNYDLFNYVDDGCYGCLNGCWCCFAHTMTQQLWYHIGDRQISFIIKSNIIIEIEG